MTHFSKILMGIVTTIIVAVLLFCPGSHKASANLPSCFQIDSTLQQWTYILPGACATPIPYVSTPPSQTALWSQGYLTAQGYGSTSPNYNVGLNNYINIMSDTVGSFTPTNLSFAILGGDSRLQHILFQNSNGTYFLALWQNTFNYQSTTPPWGNPPDGSTVPEFVSIEVAGNSYQTYATRWKRNQVVQYFIQPTSCGNNYCFAAAVTSSLLMYQIGPWGFTPITLYGSSSGSSTPTPSPSPSPSPTATPTPNPSASPTAGPLTAVPNTLAFVNQLSSPQFVTISDPLYTGNFGVSVSPLGLVSTAISGNALTVTPEIPSSGSGIITVTDGTRTFPIPFSIGVAPSPSPSPSPSPTPTPTPTPTPGPFTGTPTSLTFALTTSPCQNVTLSDPGFGGTFVPTVLPINVVLLTLTTSTNLQVCPNTVGTATISVSDTFNTININAGVTATPAPGTVSLSPSGPYNFANPGAGSQVITASQINYAGCFTYAIAPTTIATLTSACTTVTVTPISSNTGGGTATLTVTGGNSTTATGSVVVAPFPGPITANPSSYTFLAPTGSINAIVTDPLNTVTLTASSSNTSVATVTISGSPTSATAVITAVGAGTTTITYSDGVRTGTTAITVNSVTVPNPTYTNYTPAPAGGYPVKISALPLTTHPTLTAILYCVSNSGAGGAVLGGAGTFGLEGGLCDGSTNQGRSIDNHMYDQIGNQQASSTNNLVSGTFYLVGGSTDGVNVNNFVCVLPNTTNDCVQYTTPDTATWTAGNIVAYIGGAADGISRILGSGEYVYNLAIFGTPLNIYQFNLYSTTLLTGTPPYPYPTATATGTPPPSNGGYQSPAPPFTHGLGLTSTIQYSKTQITSGTAGSGSCGTTCVRSYNASALSTYTGYFNSNSGARCSGCVPGYDPGSSLIAYSTLVQNGGSTNGTQIAYAQATDPVYHLICKDYCGTAPAGITQYSIGSYHLDINIPLGYRTQNSGNNNCDCHAVIVEYAGFTAGGVLANIAPYQYEFDIENAGYGTTATAAESCNDQATTACTTFNNNSGNGYISGHGASLYTTAGTGFNGCASAQTQCNGFSPGATFPGGNTGCGYHGCISFPAQSVNAQDMLFAYTNGYVDHVVGLGMVCLENAQSDAIVTSLINTDYGCKLGEPNNTNGTIGTGVGWSYSDFVTLNRSIADINSDLSNGVLTVPEAIAARTMVKHGAFIMDVLTPYGPTAYFRLDANDPAWATVQSKFGTSVMPNGPSGAGSVLVNFAIPWSYMNTYGEAVKTCVILNNC